MLCGEDFGRSHEAGLVTIVQSDQHAHHRYQCFSAPYIPLEKPVHLFSRSAILPDFPDHPFLCFGQFKRKVMVVKSIEIIAYNLERMAFKIGFPLVFQL